MNEDARRGGDKSAAKMWQKDERGRDNSGGTLLIVESMSRSRWARFRGWIVGSVLAFGLVPALAAESVAVRHVEGTLHGFLALRAEDGHLLAVGDLIEVVQGSRVTSHLVFRFKDGSVDDETTVYSQRGTFRLISDHHIQKGPSYSHPLDMQIDVRRGVVTTRTTGKDGKEEVKTDSLKLPPDLANGMVLTIAKNLAPDKPETKVSMIVATPKPRVVTLVITPRTEEPFSVLGSARKARRFEIKIELGGVAGVVAPLVGKQPPNIQIWIAEGPAPGFVKEQGPFYEGGPIWAIELASPVWANEHN
ncbi:MAG TPA: hypothetical protein VGN01_02265 [Acidobacteriaceae bacterium]